MLIKPRCTRVFCFQLLRKTAHFNTTESIHPCVSNMTEVSLRNVEKLIKNKKDPDFTSLCDVSQTQYYANLRHKYDILYENSRNQFEHLRLFTKHLKKIVEKNKLHFSGLKDDLLDYRREEPSLQPIRHSVTKSNMNDDEISLHLPSDFDDGRAVSPSQGATLGKKPTEEAMADVYNYDWKLANVGAIFSSRIQNEVLTPLAEFRKQYQQKLHKIHENVALQYDKMIKHGMTTREKQVSANEIWNELCDCRARLDKAIKNKKESKISKHNGRVQASIKKCKKSFDEVVELVDKYNEIQNEFWNISLIDGTNQLEAINHIRVALLQEYMKKYCELLEWKRAEERNGEEELGESMKALMTPAENVKMSLSGPSFEYGNYHDHDTTEYQIPCMPDEVATVGPPLSQQRIDPTVILPVYDPFGDELNNSGSNKRLSSVRSVSSVRSNKNASAAVLTTQRSSFFADNTAKLFARTINQSSRRVSASGVSPTSENENDHGKHSSLALLQSVSRTPSMDDAKEESTKKNLSIGNDDRPNHAPQLSPISKSQDSCSPPSASGRNASTSTSKFSQMVNDSNRPPLPPRAQSHSRLPNNNSNGRRSLPPKPITTITTNGTSSQSPSPSPRRDGRSGMTSDQSSDSKESDSESDDNDGNDGASPTSANSPKSPKSPPSKERPPKPNRPLPSRPPPPKKDAKSVASVVVRKATLESKSPGGSSAPALPPRGRPGWKMTMN